jgi:hypothetical protein
LDVTAHALRRLEKRDRTREREADDGHPPQYTITDAAGRTSLGLTHGAQAEAHGAGEGAGAARGALVPRSRTSRTGSRHGSFGPEIRRRRAAQERALARRSVVEVKILVFLLLV